MITVDHIAIWDCRNPNAKYHRVTHIASCFVCFLFNQASSVIKCTFLPIPLVGDGAGDTGTKSMRFGDEDADFSKSLSLCKHTVTHTDEYRVSHIRCAVG